MPEPPGSIAWAVVSRAMELDAWLIQRHQHWSLPFALPHLSLIIPEECGSQKNSFSSRE